MPVTTTYLADLLPKCLHASFEAIPLIHGNGRRITNLAIANHPHLMDDVIGLHRVHHRHRPYPNLLLLANKRKRRNELRTPLCIEWPSQINILVGNLVIIRHLRATRNHLSWFLSHRLTSFSSSITNF